MRTYHPGRGKKAADDAAHTGLIADPAIPTKCGPGLVSTGIP